MYSNRKCFVRTATDVAGEIIEVGSEVKNFKAGDNVVAILNHFVSAHWFSFGSFVYSKQNSS